MNELAVLLPVRNAADTLGEALASLWIQTHREFRVIAVDDGSTDATAAILESHAAQDRRLTVIRTEPRGLVPALETARAEAATTNATLVARMDADDKSHPDRLAMQVRYLGDNPQVSVVGCKVRIFPHDRVKGGWARYDEWINGLFSPAGHARESHVESPLAHPSVMMRAQALDEVGGYRDPAWPEDYDLWLRFHTAGHALGKVNRVLLAWRDHPDRISTTTERYSLDAFMAARTHYLAQNPALAGKKVRIWGAGRTGKRLARELEKHGVKTVTFYEVAPGMIGRLRRGAPIKFWEDLEPPDGVPLLVAVGAHGARDLIRPALAKKGYVEGESVFFAS